MMIENIIFPLENLFEYDEHGQFRIFIVDKLGFVEKIHSSSTSTFFIGAKSIKNIRHPLQSNHDRISIIIQLPMIISTDELPVYIGMIFIIFVS
ncbi:unnamed protein product [Rotaria sordida]|uniref:Uncharacterized protein n=1 Tax=Rotaria sordida TaxID=392033 RepID=A0A819I879_9BILA|nr:unnamed protein product [Rotaria sordida]